MATLQDLSNGKPLSPQKKRKTNKNKLNFIVSSTNGSKLVISFLSSKNMVRVLPTCDPDYYIQWTDDARQVQWESFLEFHNMVNHIPNSNAISNKRNLLQSLRQHEKFLKLRNPSVLDLSMETFVPQTFYINNPKEFKELEEKFEGHNIWIFKPTNLNQGNGISLIRTMDSLNDALQKDKCDMNKSKRITERIVQKYITNPLLIDKKKFDIRVYMLICSTAPYIVLYHDGYLRLSMEQYSNDSENMLTHLTNQYVQKKDPKYQEVKNDTVLNFKQFNDYLNANLEEYKKVISKNWVYRVMKERMKSIMRQVFFAAKGKLKRGVGLFELFGFDFLIDSNFSIWLIEVNMNPALDTNCEILKEVIPDVVQSTLDVAIECFEKCKQNEPILPLSNCGQFEVVYSEEAHWNWMLYFDSLKPTISILKIRHSLLRRGSVNTSGKTSVTKRVKSNMLQNVRIVSPPRNARHFPEAYTQKQFGKHLEGSPDKNDAVRWTKG